MINIRNIPETAQLTHDPDLQREVTSYLLYCRHELLEFADEDDPESLDLNFMVIAKTKRGQKKGQVLKQQFPG